MSGGWEIREIFVSLLDAELLQAANKERQRSVCEIQICSQPQKTQTHACISFDFFLSKQRARQAHKWGELHIIKS
jgi:hypothetical protein